MSALQYVTSDRRVAVSCMQLEWRCNISYIKTDSSYATNCSRHQRCNIQLYVTPDSWVEGHAHIIWQTVQQGCTTWLLVSDTINCTVVLVYVTPDNSLHCVAWRACWALPTLYPGRQHSGDASHGSRHQCCIMRCTAVLVYVAPDSCVAWRVCPHYILADSTAGMHHHMVPGIQTPVLQYALHLPKTGRVLQFSKASPCLLHEYIVIEVGHLLAKAQMTILMFI